MGRQQFAKDHGIDLDGEMSIKEFIKLTKNAYGGKIINELEKAYCNRLKINQNQSKNQQNRRGLWYNIINSSGRKKGKTP